jgi:hypothetical protein
MQTLNQAAGFDAQRQNTLANLEELCGKLKPDQGVNSLVPTLEVKGFRQGNVMDAITYRIGRARMINREILNFTTYLESKLVNDVAAVDSCSLFQNFGYAYDLFSKGSYGNTARLRASASATSLSAPRSSSVSARTPVAGMPHTSSRPSSD